MEASQRREPSSPALQFEILKCDLRIETKLDEIPGSFFCRHLGQFSVCKTESLFRNCRSVCLSDPSASLTHLGVTLAKFSTSDPWRLTPRRHRVPIALTQTLDLSQTPPRAAPSVLTSRIRLDDLNRSLFGAIKPSSHKKQQHAVARNSTTTTTSALD